MGILSKFRPESAVAFVLLQIAVMWISFETHNYAGDGKWKLPDVKQLGSVPLSALIWSAAVIVVLDIAFMGIYLICVYPIASSNGGMIGALSMLEMTGMTFAILAVLVFGVTYALFHLYLTLNRDKAIQWDDVYMLYTVYTIVLFAFTIYFVSISYPKPVKKHREVLNLKMIMDVLKDPLKVLSLGSG